LGLIGVCVGASFIVGPGQPLIVSNISCIFVNAHHVMKHAVLGGGLASFDLRLPFALSAAIHLVNALFVFFCVPETLPALSSVATMNKFLNVGFGTVS
jgi:hypothetical protein